MDPLISIIIPTFNRAEFLTRTINSVIQQEYGDWECLIIDDGSTDQTVNIVRSFSDDRIKYFYKKNEERSIARNYGIERAQGQYICFLDSDDTYFSNHLSSLYKKIKSESFPVAIFNTSMYEVWDGVKTLRPVYSKEEYLHPIFFVWKKFLLINSVCVHKGILKEHKFPEKYNVWEDTHLWLRITAKYPFFQLQEITTQWILHKGGSVTKAFDNIDVTYVKNYINCISDLFENYREEIHSFLDNKDRRDYQLKKLKMFMRICFQKKHYTLFFNLFAFGIRKVSFKALCGFTFSLLNDSFRSKVHRLKRNWG